MNSRDLNHESAEEDDLRHRLRDPLQACLTRGIEAAALSMTAGDLFDEDDRRGGP